MIYCNGQEIILVSISGKINFFIQQNIFSILSCFSHIVAFYLIDLHGIVLFPQNSMSAKLYVFGAFLFQSCVFTCLLLLCKRMHFYKFTKNVWSIERFCVANNAKRSCFWKYEVTLWWKKWKGAFNVSPLTLFF